MRRDRLAPAFLAALLLTLPLGCPAKHLLTSGQLQQQGGAGGEGQGQAPMFSTLATFSSKPGATTPAATATAIGKPAVLRQPKNKCSGVRCPDKSKCTLLAGAATCKCPNGQRFMGGYKCRKGALRFGSYLDPHNNARAAVGSPMLRWDDNLAASALKWVRYLAPRCALEIGGYPDGAGQNVANVRNTDAPNAQAVGLWVSQGSKYSYARFDGAAAGCSTGRWMDCGAYTQVIWSRTRSVGCASASCPGGSGKVWACNYSPAGNVMGEFPYPIKKY